MKNTNKQPDKTISTPDGTPGADGRIHPFPEVICGKNKTPEQLIRLISDLFNGSNGVIAVNVDDAAGIALANAFPEGEYDPAAGVFHIDPPELETAGVFIITSGKEDLPAALEAKYALAACGFSGTMIMTEGTAVWEKLKDLPSRLSCAAACIAVAGTDNALPGIVAGMVQVPVIALPATVSGGNQKNGALMLPGMLGSGRTGLTVVSTDNGIGAGFAAARIMNSKSL